MELFTLENTREIFHFLDMCEGVEQNIIYHPEGDVLNHSLQVLNLAFKESDDIDLILASMLHDIGKVIRSQGHADFGARLLRDCASVKTIFLVENHMRMWKYLNGEMTKLSKCQFLASHPWLPCLVQLTRWDHMGRNPNRKMKYDKEDIISRLNKKIPTHFGLPGRLMNEKIDAH